MVTTIVKVHEQDHAPVVFIVDDDDAVREALTLLVSMQGWQPQPYASARAFLDGYRGQHPACLLLDLWMQDMNGVELLEQLGDAVVRLPTFVITAHDDHTMARRALKLGAKAVLGKPFRNDEVALLIERALSSRARLGGDDD